jgi:ribonuclease-3
LDGGLGPAQTFIHQYFQDWLNEINPAKIDKDPKTSLQELLQSKKLMLPKYEVADIKGEAHSQEFVVKCNIVQLSIVAEASGTSRRAAEQEAASIALPLVKEKIL